VLDPNDVDSFLSVNSDGTITVFCGKVDLGQGLRIAIRQIAGEELGIGVDKIQYRVIPRSLPIRDELPARVVFSVAGCRSGKPQLQFVRRLSGLRRNSSK
jgi:Molybdopterin-binding domain of aldehyde dehydrogenase